ncbi:unnamed protein product [Bursaphelenchus okinawaensis]|uniref:Protein kinase domain-containing protein n=1 Tax=Bursaphelenchus okinawaensis TaxID=465554 RepID=A0A811LRA5_9BILA|nr:unnamed protein product [Bursaphelenchus okinawaensis]CAG9127323.1 unnamed protein product [Bursaphelenchus okinawaensis]
MPRDGIRNKNSEKFSSKSSELPKDGQDAGVREGPNPVDAVFEEYDADPINQRRNDTISKLLKTKNLDELIPPPEVKYDVQSTQSSGASDQNSRFTYGYTVEITDSFYNTKHEYVLGRRLGKGGFSEVRIAKMVGRPDFPKLAMKIVDLKKPKASRIERQPYWEIELLRRMEHSHRVIRLFESKTLEDDVLFMVLEMAGGSLEHFARKKIGNRVGFAKHYFRCCVKCVLDIHMEDILHCDIKPTNFIKSGKMLKVIDFGCATPLGPLNDAIIRKKALGTTRFMSPEYLKEKIASKALDVWSLGCILYWLVTGQKIFKDPKIYLRKAICYKQADLSAVKSTEAHDLLKQIFEHDRKKRPNCDAILNHPYLSAANDASSSTGGHSESQDAFSVKDKEKSKRAPP